MMSFISQQVISLWKFNIFSIGFIDFRYFFYKELVYIKLLGIRVYLVDQVDCDSSSVFEFIRATMICYLAIFINMNYRVRRCEFEALDVMWNFGV